MKTFLLLLKPESYVRKGPLEEIIAIPLSTKEINEDEILGLQIRCSLFLFRRWNWWLWTWPISPSALSSQTSLLARSSTKKITWNIYCKLNQVIFTHTWNFRAIANSKLILLFSISIEDSFRRTREWLERNIDVEKPNESKHDVISSAFIELLRPGCDSYPEVSTLICIFASNNAIEWILTNRNNTRSR